MLFSAAILAGGHSSRFGQDKATFIYQGKAMFTWVAESLQAADEQFIITNKRYLAFDLPQYKDIIVQQGPLSGIHAALSYAKHPWVAVAACDMPFLTADYWQILKGHIDESKQATLVETENGLEPLAAFYHKSALSTLQEQLQQGQRATHKAIQKLDVSVISFANLDLHAKTLANINTLSELD